MMGRNAFGTTTSCPKTPALVNNFRRMPMSILETPALIKRPSGDTIKTAVVGPSPVARSATTTTRPFWMFSDGPKASPVGGGVVRETVSGFSSSLADSSTSFVGSRKENIPRNVEERPAKRVCFEPLPLQPQRNTVKWAPKNVPAQVSRQAKPEASKQQQQSKPDPKKFRIITGSVEHILKLSRSAPEEAPLVELYANILTMKQGAHGCERILLLRNKSGPVIQGVFFEIDFRMSVMGVGDFVRCVGRLTGGSRLQILKLTVASEDDELMGFRLQKVSGFAAEFKR